MTGELKPLSKKHELFVTNLILCKLNATEAYLRTYPNSNPDSARASASALLTNLNVQKALRQRIDEYNMTADEALMLQADIARGDITKLLDDNGMVDIKKIKASGYGRLIKKIKQRTITKIGKGDKDDDTEIHDTEIEIHDAQLAQVNILKMGGKLQSDLIINVKITDD